MRRLFYKTLGFLSVYKYENRMISLEEFKEHIPKELGLSEEEIKKVREIQDGLAEIFFAM